MYRMKGNSIAEHAKYEPEHGDSDDSRSEWYYSREEIENSKSRKDGIDLKREIYFRISYSTFLQDLGMRLGLPQITIATATTLCHRFFQQQSHAKNDRTTIAISCMFLAGKAEDTALPVNQVILKSYETLSRKNPLLYKKKNQKDFCEEQREIILQAEKMVLITLRFDINVHHPYRLVWTAIKNFGIDEERLTQVAWNFLNDGLRTSLWLQFKPRQIAAGTIFLAAKFLDVKLPVTWWTFFDVSPVHLKEVSEQLLELYEQMNYTTTSYGNQPDRSGDDNFQMLGKSKSNIEVTPSGNISSQVPQFDSLAASWNGIRAPQASGPGEGRKTANPDSKYSSKDAKNKSGASIDRPTDNGTSISDVSTFSGRQLNEAYTKSGERQGSKIHCIRSRDNTGGRILCNLAQGSGPSANSTCPQKNFAWYMPNREKFSHESSPITPQVDEVDSSILKERQADTLVVDKLGAEAKGQIQSGNAEKAKQERKMDRSESCYISTKGSSKFIKEYAAKDGNRLKRERSSDDIPSKDIISEKRRKCSFDQADLQAQEMVPKDDPHDELEEGEIPNSPTEKSVHSLEAFDGLNVKDSMKWSDYCGPEPSRNRFGFDRCCDYRGSRHNSNDRKMSPDYHRSYHPSDRRGRDHGRDWRRPTDRIWEEKDHGRDWERATDRHWEKRDRRKEWKRPTNRSWEEQSYKRNRCDDGK